MSYTYTHRSPFVDFKDTTKNNTFIGGQKPLVQIAKPPVFPLPAVNNSATKHSGGISFTGNFGGGFIKSPVKIQPLVTVYTCR